MELEVFNLETGDRLGLFTVSMYISYEHSRYVHDEFIKFQTSVREGSIDIDPTNTPTINMSNLLCTSMPEVSVFTLHG